MSQTHLIIYIVQDSLMESVADDVRLSCQEFLAKVQLYCYTQGEKHCPERGVWEQTENLHFEIIADVSAVYPPPGFTGPVEVHVVGSDNLFIHCRDWFEDGVEWAGRAQLVHSKRGDAC